ncbi:protein phosphatase [Strigomonas culicis]|uniref:Serine/threonine-protein phosphatase n=1 Tax=Strigomonas culicis TaxID=28005 RepID=S9TMT8_9TRYP|nr:protein phosphatase [Strigomonas culicis]|eukprot:EPY18069.1 protein phosphatase [Strigomonas culicis]
MTANGRDMLQQQVNEDDTGPFALAASKRVAEAVEAKFNARENVFSPFSAEEKTQLLSLFQSIATCLLQRLLCTPPVLHLRSPLLCCGDIHGSFRDLHTVLEQGAPFGHWSLLYAPILLLGDFVDRGPHSVEVILVLFSWALLCPDTVYLVRGNHEDPSVNGNCDLYGDRSFIALAKAFFGDEDGSRFWELTNTVFSFLPVAAVVDDTVFACHGGIPCLTTALASSAADASSTTPLRNSGSADLNESIPTEALFEALLEEEDGGLYRFETVLRKDTDDAHTAMRRRLVRELLWNDPAKQEDGAARHWSLPGPGASPSGSSTGKGSVAFDLHGFRCNRGRNDVSGDIHEFSESALTHFLERFGFALLLRAHQQKDTGVEVVKRRRIITLFSCCDYAYGCSNCAGACLICGGLIRLISWYPRPKSTSLSRFSQRLFGSDSNAPSLNTQQLAECDRRRFRFEEGDSSTREMEAAAERFRQRPLAEAMEYG